MSSAEALSLEETNKTRIALGLAPLADPNAATDEAEPTEDEVAADNYAREKSARDNARREADARDRLEKARNQRELQAKLSGKGLGEAAASNEEDVKSWLKKSKKKAKSMAADLAKRRAAEQAELDAELQAKYDEEDLAGMKVGHSMEDFDGESEAVLTLKDSRITGEENEDELENVSMAERARNEDRLRLAREGKRGKQYNPYGDDEEFTAPGKKRGVLSKYDVDIPGADQSESSEGFTLGQGASSRDAAGHAKVFEAVDKPVQKTAEARKQVAQQLGQTLNADLNYERDFAASDYAQETDTGFKKSKKKKSKKEGSSRRRQAEAADPDSIQVDEPAQSRTSAAELEEQVMMDDEGLQAALSRQRRARSRKNAEAIKRVAEQQPSTSDSPMLVDGNGTSGLEVKQEDDLDEGGLVLDDTSEFVRSLNPTALEEQKPARTTNTNAVPTASAPSPSFAPTTANGTTSTAPIPVELEEGEQPDTEMAPKEELQELDVASKQEEDDAFGGTSREVLVSGGLGATLNLLKQQGLVKGATEDELQRDSQFKNRQAWLAARRQDQMDVLAAQQARRAQGHSNPKGGQNYEQRQREMENKQRERDLANRELDRFKDYKPTVDIKYHDEYGRQMNQKEAWKHLSHRFHGKGSGVKKQEARLKRVEDEQRQARMASGDTPLNTNAAFQARQERLGSATMVLSVGNKSTAPGVENFQSSTTPDMAKQPKASSSKKRQQQGISGQDTVNLTPMLDTTSGAGTPTGDGGVTPATAPKRAGFKRVGKREAEESPAPQSDSSKRSRQE